MRIKTSELEGAALDWAVAKAVGQHLMPNMWILTDSVCPMTGEWEEAIWSPSEDWSQGGPLIEEHRIMVEPLTRMDHPEGGWHAGVKHKFGVAHGSTALVAAMRAIVLDTLGDEVEVPAELGEG